MTSTAEHNDPDERDEGKKQNKFVCMPKSNDCMSSAMSLVPKLETKGWRVIRSDTRKTVNINLFMDDEKRQMSNDLEKCPFSETEESDNERKKLIKLLREEQPSVYEHTEFKDGKKEVTAEMLKLDLHKCASFESFYRCSDSTEAVKKEQPSEVKQPSEVILPERGPRSPVLIKEPKDDKEIYISEVNPKIHAKVTVSKSNKVKEFKKENSPATNVKVVAKPKIVRCKRKWEKPSNDLFSELNSSCASEKETQSSEIQSIMADSEQENCDKGSKVVVETSLKSTIAAAFARSDWDKSPSFVPNKKSQNLQSSTDKPMKSNYKTVGNKISSKNTSNQRSFANTTIRMPKFKKEIPQEAIKVEENITTEINTMEKNMLPDATQDSLMKTQLQSYINENESIKHTSNKCNVNNKIPVLKNPSIKNPVLQNQSIKNPVLKNLALRTPAMSNPALRTPAMNNPALRNNPTLSNPVLNKPLIGSKIQKGDQTESLKGVQRAQLYKTTMSSAAVKRWIDEVPQEDSTTSTSSSSDTLQSSDSELEQDQTQSINRGQVCETETLSFWSTLCQKIYQMFGIFEENEEEEISDTLSNVDFSSKVMAKPDSTLKCQDEMICQVDISLPGTSVGNAVNKRHRVSLLELQKLQKKSTLTIDQSFVSAELQIHHRCEKFAWPQEALCDALIQLQDESWESKVRAIDTISCIAKQYPEVIFRKQLSVMDALDNCGIKDNRFDIHKLALFTLTDLFFKLKFNARQALERLCGILFYSIQQTSGDQELQKHCNNCLLCLIKGLLPPLLAEIFINYALRRNTEEIVHRIISYYLLNLVEYRGTDSFLQQPTGTTGLLIKAAASYAQSNIGRIRECGIKILLHLQLNPNFDEVLNTYLTRETAQNVFKVIQKFDHSYENEL